MVPHLALGLRLLTSGCAVLAATATPGAPAAAEQARRASRQTIIEEIAPPRRESFEGLVLQLPPLVPARRKAEAAAVAEAPPVARSAVPLAPSHPPEARVEPRAPKTAEEADGGNAPAPIEARHSEQAAEAAPLVESQPALHAAAPEAEAPQGPTVAEHAEPSLTPSEPPAVDNGAPLDLRAEPPSEALPPEAKTDAVAPPPPVVDVAPPVTAPASARVASDEEGGDSFLETWQWIVIAFALAGLLASRSKRGKSVAAPKGADDAPQKPQTDRLVALARTARSKIDPIVAAVVQRLLSRNAGPANPSTAAKAERPSAEAKRSAIANWTEIAATLRAKVASTATAGRERSTVAVAAETAAAAQLRAERGRWEQSEQEGFELLEPGAVGARAIVMNARRKLQAAQS